MPQAEDDIYSSITLAQFCKRSALPRQIIERYLVAAGRKHLLKEPQFLASWQFLIADLPAFQCYLKYNIAGRSETAIAERADAITIELWRYAIPRQQDRTRTKQRLRRIRDRLKTLQARTSPNEKGERVSRIIEDFPYIEAELEHRDAWSKIRPARPPSVSEMIAVADLMIAALPKTGQRGMASLRKEFVEKLAADHQWLTGRSRCQYAGRFREFVEDLLHSDLNGSLSKDGIRSRLTAKTLIR